VISDEIGMHAASRKPKRMSAASEMFQFPGLASYAYGFSVG